jgi:prolipoprotein diacylglyceryltransferase
MREQVTRGAYRCLSVPPTQLYTSASAAMLCLILYGFWRRSRSAERVGTHAFATKPGSVFSLMFIFYGVMRFLMELARDDNPFEIDHLTIAQLLGIGLVILGAVFLALLRSGSTGGVAVDGLQGR